MAIRPVIFTLFTLPMLLAGLLFGQNLHAQSNCNNPIVLSSILISNATCNNSTGAIILNVSGSGYQFNWSPSVSVSNVASNLQAGTYQVSIVRTNEPACTLDTTIVVNNSNGPSIQVSAIEPANCLASNGRIAVTPATLNYTWSNGATGPVNDNLTSGCYFVTATGSGGCYSVHKVCISNTNPLQTQAIVLQNAKCNLPTGAANVVVSGGSGLYDYTLNPGPPFTGLAAGPYTVGITDIMTGCQDEASFVVDNIPVSAEVTLQTQNVRCPGESNGQVNITVEPDTHFALPYSAVIMDGNGQPAVSGNLLPGSYTLRISDADGCQLPEESFSIEAPPPFVSQALVIPGDCDNGGQILLTVTGGTGPKQVDWQDVPGTNNTEDRQNLEPGIYSATVKDSLECTFTVNPILVAFPCTRTDTFLLDVQVNNVDTFCMPLPIGVQPGTATFFLPANGGVNFGSSSFGAWALQPNGCLIYSAGNTAGLRIDTICIASTVNPAGLSDTICVLVNIVTQPCLPVHNYVPDGNGTISWMLPACNADTVFCTNIPSSQLANWIITDNLQQPAELVACGPNVGIRLDTGLHTLRIRSVQTTCSYDVRVLVNCNETAPTDTTYAVPDATYTDRGESISIPILNNDVVLGQTGNIGGLAAVEFLNIPATGQYSYNSTMGILTYTPDQVQCGQATFLYELTDSAGQQSQATVTITVICGKIVIFNGISPNGDSLNDEWHMPGIDQYPNNEVRVFNRWGQQVFEKTGYTNAQGWDGRWNGRDLPDGTYFYTVDLKDGSEILKGFLQIQR